MLAECVSFIVPLNSMSLHVRLHFQTIYLHHQFRCSYCVGLSAFKTQEIIYVRKTWRRLQYVYYRLQKAKVVKS